MSELIKDITLPEEIVSLCRHFAEASYQTNLDCYKRRGQSSPSKIKNDIFTGKLAEWGVFFSYLQRGRPSISVPDMKVYEVRDKSYDADLTWGLYRLHVKSQTVMSAMAYGSSWMLQTKDPLFDFNDEYDILIGCQVVLNETGATVVIQIEKPFSLVKFSVPRLSRFIGDKVAFYLDHSNE